MPRTVIGRKRTTTYPANTYGMSFNDSSSFGSSAIDLSSEDQLTIRMVFQFTEEIVNVTLLELTPNYNSVNTGFNVSIQSDRSLGAAIRDIGYSQMKTNEPLEMWKYYEAVITLDKQQIEENIVKIYINGYADYKLTHKQSNPGSNFANSTLYLGSRGGAYLFSGLSLHLLEICSGIKTPTQVEEIYGTNDTDPNALHSWKNTSIDDTKIAAVNGGLDFTMTDGVGILEPPVRPRRKVIDFDNSVAGAGAGVSVGVANDAGMSIASDDFYIEGDFFYDNLGTSQIIITKRNITSFIGYDVFVDANGKLNGVFDSGNFANFQHNRPVKRGWNHFIFVADRDDQSASGLMLNGIVDCVADIQGGSYPGTAGDIDNTEDIEILARQGSLDMLGKIARMKIVKGYVPTRAEQLAKYYEDTAIVGGTEIVNYQMTDGSGATITDSSGNNFDMTINTGAVWSTQTPSEPRTVIGSARTVIS